MGKPVSQTTGLYYYYHRWYDSSTGRFVSTDPKKGNLANPQSLNPYVYVDNSPTSITDPTGDDGGFGVDNRCERLHQCPSPGPDPTWTWLNNHVIQPTTNFVNTNVVQPLIHKVVMPIVTNIVVPIVNNVVIPLAKDYIAANSYVNQALTNVGNQMWNGYQSFQQAQYNYQQSLFNSVNQGWQAFAHDVTHLHVTNPTQFLVGMLACAGTAAFVASLVLAPEAVPLEVGAEEVATEGAIISATSAAAWAYGAAESGGLLLILGGACVSLTAGSLSTQ